MEPIDPRSFSGTLTFEHEGEQYTTEIMVHSLLQTELVEFIRLRKLAEEARQLLREGWVEQGDLEKCVQRAEELLRIALKIP